MGRVQRGPTGSSSALRHRNCRDHAPVRTWSEGALLPVGSARRGDKQIGAKIAEGDIDMVIFRTFDLLVASCALCRARVEPTKQSLPVLPPTPLSCRAVEDCPRTKLA